MNCVMMAGPELVYDLQHGTGAFSGLIFALPRRGESSPHKTKPSTGAPANKINDVLEIVETHMQIFDTGRSHPF